VNILPDDYSPLLVFFGTVLSPAFVTVCILVIRRPDHPRRRQERHGFPIEPLDDGD
jgi:hypothetical protein